MNVRSIFKDLHNVDESKYQKTKYPHLQPFNPLTPGTFRQNVFFFYILVVSRLDLGQISFSLAENAFAT